ncbi:DNA cytosine methyltransferase [Peribacillus sp. SCS-26]|uniref:DNA cytosine methyltransferase n=1 Tax=Paraperibacillus marinus TaxID=3115295 RepID=UPI003905D848
MTEKFKVMDLFAGAGGLSNGFEQTGKFESTIVVEINKYARATFQENHKNSNITYFEDVAAIQYKDDNGKLKDLFEEIDVIIGGPPCQGFSNANRQKNSLISSNNQLVKEYLRAIEEIRPKAFVMENVRTMDSDKHKFYLSFQDEEELATLGIEPKEEKIVIGANTSFSNVLRTFLEEAVDKQLDLSSYLLGDDLFTKLNALLRHGKKEDKKQYTEFIRKQNNINFFSNLFNQDNWIKAHLAYWNPEYEYKWKELLSLFKLAFNDGKDQIVEINYLLEEILTVQKIISKINEIIKYNVKLYSLISSEEGLSVSLKSFNVFSYIKRKLKDLNYEFNDDNQIFNAAQFGVPQERKRLILIGVHKEYLKAEKVYSPSPILSQDKYIKIKEAIKDIEELQPSTHVEDDEMDRGLTRPLKQSRLNEYLNNNKNNKLYNHVRTETRELALKRFKALKEGQNFHNLDESLKDSYADHSRTQNTVYKRLSYEEPSGTVLNVRKSMWIHPIKDRAISIREAARLQSFQDSYKFFGPKDSQYQQIGNAVPPLLARAVAESLLENLGSRPEQKLKDLFYSEVIIKV